MSMRGEGWATLVVSIVGLLLFLGLARACAPAESPEPACTGEWCQDMQEQRDQFRYDNEIERDR